MPVGDLTADARISPSGIVSPDQAPAYVSSEIQWPVEIQLGGLLDPKLFFRKPLPVRLYKDQDVYVARSVQVDQFGYGSNVAEALDDLGRTLSEMYVYLSDAARSGALVDSLAAQHQELCEFIGSRPRHAKAA
jgi:hypothetical protein